MYVFYFTTFDTLGHDKYISRVEKIYPFIVIPPKHPPIGGDPLQDGVGSDSNPQNIPDGVKSQDIIEVVWF